MPVLSGQLFWEYILSAEGNSANPGNVDKVKNWLVATGQKKLTLFPGAGNVLSPVYTQFCCNC